MDLVIPWSVTGAEIKQKSSTVSWLVSKLETITFDQLAQRTPDDMDGKIMQFPHLVIAARQQAEYPLSRINNMDEMLMRFKLPSTCSLEFTGRQTVPVKTCGAQKQSFTVALCMLADGRKLPPKVILKGVHFPKDLAVPPCFLSQERVDGQVRRERVDLPMFATNPS